MLDTPLRAIMLDDDPVCRENLTELLQAYCPEVEVLACFSKASEALAFLLHETIDLLFLDVEMPEVNGFDFLELLPQRDFSVIFVTGHPGYAVPAFRVAAVDYLLKPVSPKDLREAVSRVGQGDPTAALPRPAAPASQAEPARLTLRTMHGFMVVEVQNIVFLEANNTYVAVHLANGKKLLVKKSMTQFETELDETLFVRIHKSYIIHLRAMEEYSNLDGGTVLMQGGHKLPIARRKLRVFHERVKNYSQTQ